MKAFHVEGTFRMGRNPQPFTLRVVVADQAQATERAYTELGSRHGAKRRDIVVTKVEPIAGEALDHITEHRLRKHE